MLTPEQKNVLIDVTRKAAKDALDAAIRSAELMPLVEFRAACLLQCAFRLTQAAAATYVAVDTREIPTNLRSPVVVDYFLRIVGAWGKYPDGEAMDKAMAEGLAAVAVGSHNEASS